MAPLPPRSERHPWLIYEVEGYTDKIVHDFEDRLGPRSFRCISSKGQAPEKVTATDLFYLRSMDEGIAVNVPYLLAQYLFRHAEGKERGARMSGGQFVGLLAEHFRQQDTTAGAAQGDPNIVEEGALAVKAPMQPPPGPRAAALAPQTMP
ncbi:hypothetical protein Tco_1512931 [Tanacetum coccineum]